MPVYRLITEVILWDIIRTKETQLLLDYALKKKITVNSPLSNTYLNNTKFEVIIILKLYGSETCGKCDVIKKKLDREGIEYEFVSDEVIVKTTLPADEHIPMLYVNGEFLNFANTCKWIKECATNE